MKTMLPKLTSILLTTLLAGTTLCADTAVEHVLFKAGKVLAVQAGKPVEATNDFSLTGDIMVKTNGTFSVLKGKERPFREGDALNRDGMLTRTDGSITPVVDHIVLKSGRPMLVKEGESSPLTREYTLGDGTRIQPDATVIAPNGRRSRLLDGQLQKLNGEPVPAQDSIQLKNGKVTVHKDGSPRTLRPEQTVMMSDGTKVFGNGTAIQPDGTKLTLKEGEIVPLSGVATRKR